MRRKRNCKKDTKMLHEMNVIAQADYFISHRSTVRATALAFGVSKSCVHRNLTKVLPKISATHYFTVKDILDKNKAERHIRGGLATRKMYLSKKK